jgi:hypothetical protein
MVSVLSVKDKFMNEIERLKVLHYKIRQHLTDNNYHLVVKILDSLDDINEMKTALIITQGFQEHPIIAGPRAALDARFKSKLDKL